VGCASVGTKHLKMEAGVVSGVEQAWSLSLFVAYISDRRYIVVANEIGALPVCISKLHGKSMSQLFTVKPVYKYDRQ